MKKKQKRQRKLRKCERGIRTSRLVRVRSPVRRHTRRGTLEALWRRVAGGAL